MNVWFLRFSHPATDAPTLKEAKLAPVLFREIPTGHCALGMDEEAIQSLVSRHYPSPGTSSAARGQYAGALTRFLNGVQVGDVVAICLNRDAELFYGEVLEGNLVEFPGIQNSKARPVRWLDGGEANAIQAAGLRPEVTSYSGTICYWGEWDAPDADEMEKRAFYADGPAPGGPPGSSDPTVHGGSVVAPPSAAAGPPILIEFIRVGVDLGCGGRLSRLFPGGYYHFIPIPQHNDPEFCRFTYGDVSGATKFRSLLGLRKDDILVFYAGFDPAPATRPPGRVVAIFAYFVVDELYVFHRDPGQQVGVRAANLPRATNLASQFGTLANQNDFQHMLTYCGNYNQHAVVTPSSRLELIVCGRRRRGGSRLLEKAEVLAAANPAGKYLLPPAVAAGWGLKPDADLTRCPVRTVAPSMVAAVAARLGSLP